MTGKKKCKIDHKKCKKVLKDLSGNYWAISTAVLAILLIGILSSGGITCAVISSEEAGQKVLDFASQQGIDAELVSTADGESLYEIVLSINGQESPVYVTKDGKVLVPQPILLTARVVQDTQTPSQPTPTTFSEEDNIKIQEFSSCLAEKGFRIYGAGWCGHCQTVIETFGGMQNMEGVFIECSDANQQPTEYAQLCSEQEIRGFPTMKLNDEILQISRTFEAIAEATGCSAPELD